MTEAEQQQLIDDHFLFDKPVSPLLLASGMARDWPDARGIWCVSPGPPCPVPEEEGGAALLRWVWCRRASSRETLTSLVRRASGGWGRRVGVSPPSPRLREPRLLFALSFPTRRPRGVGQVRDDADASSSGGGEQGSQAPDLIARSGHRASAPG